MSDRYYVTELAGYEIDPSRHHLVWSNGERPPGISCSVLDRLVCHRDVATFSSGSTQPVTGGGRSRAWARKQARELCDRLNAQAKSA